MRREPEETLKHAEATIDLASRNGIPQWFFFGCSLRGWALAEQGKVAEGIELMRGTLTMYSSIGSEISRPHFLGLLAQALLKNNQLDEANSFLSDALKLVDNTDQRYYESELHRLEGELLAQTGKTDEAKRCFERSVQVAQQQKARSFELRGAVSLLQLGKEEKASRLLADVYNCLTEGFDTPDLKDATTLLD